MSKVYTLVRFSKTGNIYYGSYDAIGQIARNYICTPKEAYDAADDVYDMTLFWREKEKRDGCNAYTHECLTGTEPDCDAIGLDQRKFSYQKRNAPMGKGV